jgi:hypothetical protein
MRSDSADIGRKPTGGLRRGSTEIGHCRREPAGGLRVLADTATNIINQTFRATGITAYLKNGGTLERAAIMVNHASTRATQLYDRRRDDVSLDEVERILT